MCYGESVNSVEIVFLRFLRLRFLGWGREEVWGIGKV